MLDMRFFQDIVGGSGHRLIMRCRYEKLTAGCSKDEYADEDQNQNKVGAGGGIRFRKNSTTSSRRCSSWVKKRNGGVKGLRLSRSRRLTLKAIVFPIPSKIILKMYAQILQRIKMFDGFCPNIILSTHWGFPVLSQRHPSTLKYCTRTPF